MSKLLALRGVPASGKSTYALKLALHDGYIRVNRDDLRLSLFNQYVGVDENLITKAQSGIIEAALKAGNDVVVDNTNLTQRHLRDVRDLAWKHGAEFMVRDFPITLELALTRDKFRKIAGHHSVGEPVIRGFFRRFHIKPDVGTLPKLPKNFFDKPDVVGFAPYSPQRGLPSAVIVDIDGTLADLSHRSPYARDEALYLKDGFYDDIADIVNACADRHGLNVILLSGREDKFRGATEEWLVRNKFWFDELHMRATGDQRKDDIVKNELFEKHIAGKYNVDFILDDRDRVVQMWRAKGLRVLQVADGNF